VSTKRIAGGVPGGTIVTTFPLSFAAFSALSLSPILEYKKKY